MSNHICPKCETAVIAAWRQELDGNYYHDRCLPFRGLLNHAESEIAAANARIAALEALLGEAPHDPKCYSQTHCGAGSCKSPPWAEVHIMGKPHYFHEFEPGKCNCFKSRA